MTKKNPWIPANEAGDIIKKAREARTLTQDQVSDELGVDKSYISKLEGGLHHAGRSKYFPMLVEVLQLSSDDIRRLNPGAVIDSTATHNTSSAPSTSKSEVRLPSGLQAAIELYSKRFSDLLDPAWQQYLATFRWRQGEPEDPEAWVDLYRDLVRAGIVPGSN